MAFISILLPDLRGGGVERLSIDLAKEFFRLGFEPEFVLMQNGGELLDEVQAAFPVHSLECARVRELPFALARYLRARRPDGLIAAMWPMTVAAPLGRSLSRHRCSMVVSEHNRLSIQYRDWGRAHHAVLRGSMNLGYRMADARIGVSSGVADDMAQLSGLSRDRFGVIHNPVPKMPEPSHDSLNKVNSLWGAPPGARVLSVGSFKRQKNHALLLRAFAKLGRGDARLMLLGSGSLETDLRNLANEQDIAERVIFAGFHPDPTPYYHTADLFVLSSDYEGFGNVIVEALASGTPVISTDCPSGPAEILANGEFGKLVPAGDANALADAIKNAIDRPVQPDRLRARARDFAPEKAAKAYLDLLFPA